MPIYTIIFLTLTIANISFPGTSSFVGEFLILLGSFKVNTTITFFSAVGGASQCLLFCSAVYQLQVHSIFIWHVSVSRVVVIQVCHGKALGLLFK